MKSDDVEQFLAKPIIHERWENAYRTAENEAFFDEAFDEIVSVVDAPPVATFVDAGCGSCAHSIRLAKRGFLVRAVDCSESVLAVAHRNLTANSMNGQITIQSGNLLALPFEDDAVDYLLCWGVLMHVPDVEKAVSELGRVLRPGGMCVVSESNMRSFQAMALRGVRWLLRRQKAIVKKTKAGVEHWVNTPEGTLVTRETDIEWLIEACRESGLVMKQRIAGQFTEAYTRASCSFAEKLIHRFNRLYFRHVQVPQFAFGNILFLQKER